MPLILIADDHPLFREALRGAIHRLLPEAVLREAEDADGLYGMVDAAHDLSEGGLSQALVEACLRYGTGARIWLDELCERDGIDVFTALFSESTARAIVAVPRSEEVRFKDMCTARNFPFIRIGMTDTGDGSPQLEVVDHFSVGLDELRNAHAETLPKHFG